MPIFYIDMTALQLASAFASLQNEITTATSAYKHLALQSYQSFFPLSLVGVLFAHVGVRVGLDRVRLKSAGLKRG